MRTVRLVHISSSGCCNTLVTMLNNGDFWLSILFHSRVFHPCRLVSRFPLPRFQRPHLLYTYTVAPTTEPESKFYSLVL